MLFFDQLMNNSEIDLGIHIYFLVSGLVIIGVAQIYFMISMCLKHQQIRPETKFIVLVDMLVPTGASDAWLCNGNLLNRAEFERRFRASGKPAQSQPRAAAFGR